MRIIILLLISLILYGCKPSTPITYKPRKESNAPLKSYADKYKDTTGRTTVTTPTPIKIDPKVAPIEQDDPPPKAGPITLKIEKEIDLAPTQTFNSYTAAGATKSDKIHTFQFNSDLSSFKFIINDKSTNLVTDANYRVIAKWDGSMKDGINVVYTKVAQKDETPIDFVISMVNGNKVASIKLGQNTFWVPGTSPKNSEPVTKNVTIINNTCSPITHTVLRGESAPRIALKYGISEKKLNDNNPQLKSRPGILYPGETLVIK